MTIPDQNAFLVPFLRSLSTGEAKTRAQLIDDLLKHFGLPQSAMEEITNMHMAVRVCTIYSFKGLESAVIILTELDKLYPDVAQQLMYVGLSRARNHVVVLGDQSDIKT